jgi:ribosomal protein L40E
VAEDRRLDGNAIGGLLLELFGTDMTAAPGVCAHCGAREPMAATDVYADAPGVVVRCRHCEGVLVRIVRGRDRTWIDLRGVASLEVR